MDSDRSIKLSIYGHSGSQNHGNEAIVRGVCQLFDEQKINVYAFTPSVDIKFGLDKVCNIEPFFDSYQKNSIKHIKMYLIRKYGEYIKKDYWYSHKFFLDTFLSKINGIYLLEAGDQYCENKSLREFYAYINREIKKRGGKTVMLGCTINKEFLADKNVIEDLKTYSLIIARESITYNELMNAGINKDVHIAPCPAFFMDSEKCELESIFHRGEVVGINAGFLAQGNEKYYDLMVKNTIELIKWILENTKLNIALIPHVNWSYESSDYYTLKSIYDIFYKDSKDSSRIEIISEKRANQQKYVISMCKFMVALRTHVAIPSIASQVPTLVTGYKVKSTGIIKDIFPNNFQVLVDVPSLRTDKDYINPFIWMLENENTIKKYMKENIPAYIDKVKIIKDLIWELNAKI
jgi:polysaccharide pyruvyl transferase WcaK-like protein